MASREGWFRVEVPGCWGSGDEALSLACSRRPQLLGYPGTVRMRGLGGGGGRRMGSGVPGAVGTRGGAGAPPTAYQPLWARGK